jgi:long-chain acyl-CoA synthetase
MNVTKVFDILDHQFENFPLQKAVCGKKADKSDYSFSTVELKELVDRFSTGLLKRGLKKGDKISLISYNNIPEWNIADLGLLQAGMINVSVYPNISPEDYVYIFNSAGVKYCIVGYGDLLQKVLQVQPFVPSLKKIFTFEKPEVDTDCNGVAIESWKALIECKADIEKIEEAKREVSSDDLATIIYTSGTTGLPKGVMLTHRNITSNIKSISDVILLERGDRALSYLPICHGFERTFVYCYLFKGLEIHYALNQQALGESLREVRPHIITAVPRVFEKIYEAIVGSAEKKGWLSRKIFYLAAGLTQKFDFTLNHGKLHKFRVGLADKFVFSRIRKGLGGCLKVVGIGASAVPVKLLKFFCAAGIPLREGYGLTETSAVLSVNQIPAERAMLGTVGIVLPKFEVKIIEEPGVYEKGEGEICVRGDSVFKGYYNDPASTAEAISEDGWLKTGDIGRFVRNQHGYEFIKLTDRKKELMKSSNGKYLAPAGIENRLKESNYISQTMAVGEQRKYVSALIVPEFDILNNWCKKSGITISSENGLIRNPEVIEKYVKIVEEANKHLSRHEQVKKFVLLSQNWGVESGELTPTMKMKRKVIEKKFSDVIEWMYASDSV